MDALEAIYRAEFRRHFGNDFQEWFSKIAHEFHEVGDFQSVRVTQGDGGIDAFTISEGLVYQVYAPSRIHELRDAETAAKIRKDFSAAKETLGRDLKTWCFVHNHPEGKLGKLGVTAIAGLNSENPKVGIRTLDIDKIWLGIERLSADRKDKLFRRLGFSTYLGEDGSNAAVLELGKKIDSLVGNIGAESGVPYKVLTEILTEFGDSDFGTQDIPDLLRQKAQRFKDMEEQIAKLRSGDPNVEPGLNKITHFLGHGNFESAEIEFDILSKSLEHGSEQRQASDDKHGASLSVILDLQGQLSEFRSNFLAAAQYFEKAASYHPPNSRERIRLTVKQADAFLQYGEAKKDPEAIKRSLSIHEAMRNDQSKSFHQFLDRNFGLSYGDALAIYGEFHSGITELKGAIEVYERQLKLLRKKKGEIGIARIKSHLGVAYLSLANKGDPVFHLTKAKSILLSARRAVRKSTDKSVCISIEVNLGNALARLGEHSDDASQFRQSQKSYLKALELIDGGFGFSFATVKNNTSNVSRELFRLEGKREDKARAIGGYKEAINLWAELGERSEEAMSGFNMGTMLLGSINSRPAEDTILAASLLFDKYFPLLNRPQNPLTQAWCMGRYVEYLHQSWRVGRDHSIVKLSERHREEFRSALGASSFRQFYAEALNSFANFHFEVASVQGSRKLFQIATVDYMDCISIFEESNLGVKASNSLHDLFQCQRTMADITKSEKDYKAALCTAESIASLPSCENWFAASYASTLRHLGEHRKDLKLIERSILILQEDESSKSLDNRNQEHVERTIELGLSYGAMASLLSSIDSGGGIEPENLLEDAVRLLRTSSKFESLSQSQANSIDANATKYQMMLALLREDKSLLSEACKRMEILAKFFDDNEDQAKFDWALGLIESAKEALSRSK